MSESDGELMERCKNGDMSAFDLIVQRHKTPLINFIYRFIGDRETSEDLCQETFIRIYKNINNYKRNVAQLRTWLYRIASNLCKNELRSRSRRSRIFANLAMGDRNEDRDPMENVPDATAGPDLQLEEKELQQILTQAISRLPEKLRMVLILRDLEGMSYQDISQIVKRPLGTVKSRINRGRLMLKDKMDLTLSENHE